MILSKLDSELFTKQVRFSEYNLIIILFVILPNWQKILGQTQILANLFAIIFFLQSKQKSFFYWLFLFCLWEFFKAWQDRNKVGTQKLFFCRAKIWQLYFLSDEKLLPTKQERFRFVTAKTKENKQTNNIKNFDWKFKILILAVLVDLQWFWAHIWACGVLGIMPAPEKLSIWQELFLTYLDLKKRR